MKAAADITELIGRTPLLRLGHIAPDTQVYAKCEFMNPLSIKDRAVLQIITDAEDEGRIRPGDTIIETTSGNTGMALAYIARLRGYRAVLVMSETQAVSQAILRACVAGHVRQLGGESPLYNLVEVKY